jgi:outer membrane protein OmpA-like peptidoglycan-associated protein
MRTNFFIIAIFFAMVGVAQTPADSTAIKNQQMIEQLKNRINTIDNIGNGTNAFQKQIDELKVEMARQNDSIVKLLNIINELKKYAATSSLNNQNTKTYISRGKNDNENIVSSKSLNDNDYNELNKSEAVYQEYIANCNCLPILYKPYQVELNFKTINSLNEVIKNYESNSKHKIVIVGHADKSGSEQTNMSLSKQRAEKLKSYLIIASDKIKKDDISIEWYGSSKPIKNLPENKKELNRRTEIILN